MSTATLHGIRVQDDNLKALTRAIRAAWSLQDAEFHDPWFIEPYVIVRNHPRHGSKYHEYSLRRWGAWDEPAEVPMLPWSAPTEPIVGYVFRDGDVHIRQEYR